LSQSYERRVLRVLHYIQENPAGDLSLDALADVAHMSRFHWHRVFQAMTGETCAQAVRRIRLNRASLSLLNSDRAVSDIAAEVGYPNIQSFTRAFSESFGVPPATFRKNGKTTNQSGSLHKQKSKGNFTMYNVLTETMPEKRLAAVLHKGAYTGIGKCFERLAETAASENLWPRSAGMIGVYYDDPNVVSEDDLRAHAGLVITDSQPIPHTMEEVLLPAGPCAVLKYKGPYTSIKVAYNYLYGDWLPKSGKEPADLPPYEIYLNDPAETEESELLTNIVVQLRS